MLLYDEDKCNVHSREIGNDKRKIKRDMRQLLTSGPAATGLEDPTPQIPTFGSRDGGLHGRRDPAPPEQKKPNSIQFRSRATQFVGVKQSLSGIFNLTHVTFFLFSLPSIYASFLPVAILYLVFIFSISFFQVLGTGVDSFQSPILCFNVLGERV
ncbi:hypothetical protein F5144DRAFT_2017 [Chaetomium tenue]|uniref:Uncharacterized protein n=1 Tax=Chaetomium tenue TaxID=1854479 RepID=A0ACB7PK74_9PEZI|nr:hypothetical protein F5144DRAFT_2017 [Chaetomium globosum]